MNSTASSKTDGVVVYVQTSQDGTNWSPAEEHLVAFNGNAKFFAVNVNGVNRIRVVADQNKNNAHDHAVWADAKLTNCIDDGEAVKSLESYDVQIKDKCENADLDDKELQQLVLQREFVSRVGQYALKRYMSESDDNKER